MGAEGGGEERQCFAVIRWKYEAFDDLTPRVLNRRRELHKLLVRCASRREEQFAPVCGSTFTEFCHWMREVTYISYGQATRAILFP